MTQFTEIPGIIDLSWGHPDPALLPVADLAEATARALEKYGPEMLAYGNPAGPPPLVEFVRRRLGETDAREPQSSEVVISSGVSQALDLLTTLLTSPGDEVFLDVPTYHLASRIFADHPVRLIPVDSDGDGINLDSLRQAVLGLPAAAGGRRARLLYTVPTFHNPTGRCMPVERRKQLVAAAGELNLLIIEDDTYRELSYDGPAPPSLWSLAPQGGVVRLGSFSKSVSPGLRVGYVTGGPALATRMVESGLFDSGGGGAHFSASVLAEYAGSGSFARHVEGLKVAHAVRRDALLDAMQRAMPEGVSWATPSGGYFVWAVLPVQLKDELLAAMASVHGVRFLPESVFRIGQPSISRAIRLSFSMYPEGELEVAAQRLGRALRDALAG